LHDNVAQPADPALHSSARNLESMQQRSLAVKNDESTSIWQHASYHKIMKLLERLGSIEVFQNSHLEQSPAPALC
jgi:hypothetical protein